MTTKMYRSGGTSLEKYELKKLLKGSNEWFMQSDNLIKTTTFGIKNECFQEELNQLDSVRGNFVKIK